MKQKLFIYMSTAGVLLTALFSIVIAPTAQAVDLTIGGGADSAKGIDQAATLFGSTGIFTTLSNVMLFVVGAISVIMVIVGGLRYVVSGGNTGNVATAKNTILYAVVGLIISIMAYAIVNFVIGSFAPDSVGSGTNV